MFCGKKLAYADNNNNKTMEYKYFKVQQKVLKNYNVKYDTIFSKWVIKKFY
jgi:hypothetical protein